MMQPKTMLSAIVVVACNLAFASALAWAAGDTAKQGTSATQQNTTAAASKVQRCAELKKKIAEFQAAPKGSKPPGSETIKQDIAWYQENCK